MFLYLRYQNSFLNYNIIEEEDKTFYKNVFKNILKIAAVLCVMFLASFFVGVIIAAVNNYSIKSFLLSAVLVYIVSFFLTVSIIFCSRYLKRLVIMPIKIILRRR